MSETPVRVVGHILGNREVEYAEVYAYHWERQRRIDAGAGTITGLTAAEWNAYPRLRWRVMNELGLTGGAT